MVMRGEEVRPGEEDEMRSGLGKETSMDETRAGQVFSSDPQTAMTPR